MKTLISISALAVTALLLVARVVIAGCAAVGLFTSNVAFGSPLLDFGFKSGFRRGLVLVMVFVQLFDFLLLDLRRYRFHTLARGIVDPALNDRKDEAEKDIYMGMEEHRKRKTEMSMNGLLGSGVQAVQQAGQRSKEVIISIDRTRPSTRQWMIHTREWHYRSQQLFFNRYLLCPDDAVTETMLKILDSNSSSLHDLGSVQVQEDCGCR